MYNSKFLFLLIMLILNLNFNIKKLEDIKNLVVIFLLIILTAYINDMADTFVNGNDIYVYKSTYLRYLHDDSIHLMAGKRDSLFQIITKTISLLGLSSFMYFFLLGSVQILPIYYFFRKYSKRWKISFVLYVLIYYPVFQLNILRQGIVLSLSFILLDLILNKKKISSIVLYLLLIMIHKSSIILLVLFFVEDLRFIYSIPLLMTITLFSLILGPTINKAVRFVLEKVSPLQYKHYFLSSNFFTSYRMTMRYFLYIILLTLIIIILLKILKNYTIDSNDILFFKLSYVGLLLLLPISSMVILRRLTDYFLVFVTLSLINIVTYSRYRQLYRLLFYFTIIILFFFN